MVELILFVLKILGIGIMSAIGIFLFLLLVVLFVPLTYKVEGECENQLESLKAQGRCLWLFGVFSMKFQLTLHNMEWSGHFLGFSLNPLDRKPKNTKSKKKNKRNNKGKNINKKQEESKEECKEETTVESKEEYKEETTEESKEECKEETTVEPKEEDKAKSKKREKKKEKNKDRKNKKRKYDISKTIKNICDKIKKIIQAKDNIIAFYEQEIHQYTIKKVKKELVYLFKCLHPKKLKLKAHVGFDDPSITGKFLGVLGVLYPFYGNAIEVDPDFENQIMEGTVYIAGRIQVFPFVLTIIRLVIDKKVRKTYHHISKALATR